MMSFNSLKQTDPERFEGKTEADDPDIIKSAELYSLVNVGFVL